MMIVVFEVAVLGKNSHGKDIKPTLPIVSDSSFTPTITDSIPTSTTDNSNTPTPIVINPDDMQNTTIITRTTPLTATETETASSSPTIMLQNHTNFSTCNTSATAFLSCVNDYMEKQGKSKFDQDSCSSCKKEYIQMTTKCNDDDYKHDRLLFFSFMECHVESGEYCGKSMDNFKCDDCGKFLSIKLVDYDILDKMSDTLTNGQDMNKGQYQKCSGRAKIGQKSESSTKTISAMVQLLLMVLLS